MKAATLWIVACILAIGSYAQSGKPAQKPAKNDVVLKLNGEEMAGKITAVTDADIKFIYEGETLEYVIKKSDILKITHSSGRVEWINKPALPSEQTPATPVSQPVQPTQEAIPVALPADVQGDHRNKVAVLPFAYIRDGVSGANEMSLKVQEDIYTYLAKHSAGYTLLDARTTNALLIKAGVTRETMAGFTMSELCNILGVEYIVDGTVTVNKGMASTTTTENYNAKSKNNNEYNSNSNTKVSGSSVTNSAQRYGATVAMNIHSDKDASIFSETHKAVFTTTDGSYSAPLEYLLKRTPFYRK